MKNVPLFGCLALLTLLFGPLTAQAGPQAQVDCSYSHTLGDDPIMMFGKPNQAMIHDFYGNEHTDAWSDYVSLRTKSETTCDNQADATGYWTPALRLPSGEVVHPAYQKTYYQATSTVNNPLTAFPPGLQLLAGNHHGSSPNPYVNFLCANGKGYTHEVGEVCGLRSTGDAVQFNIAIQFPDCWDGTTLAPMKGMPNAVYDVDGTCPANYPVKIPTVNLNAAWVLPQITSLDTAQVSLSMDPIMEGNQRIEQWGSLYTAHADFMNGWAPRAAEFMVSQCMNLDMDCGTNVAYDWTNAQDTYVDSTHPDDNFSASQQLLVQDDWSGQGRNTHPQIMTLVKFSIPPLPKNLSPEEDALYTYQLRTFGGKNEHNGSDQIFFYPTSTDWNVDTVNWNNRPACNYSSDAILYLDDAKTYRYVNVDQVVRDALAQGQTEVAWFIGGDRKGDTFTFNSAETSENFILMLKGYQHVPEN
ncbi:MULTISPECIES: DUF7594 domain-containing protein [Enterobacterales]|uniref:CBM96 family carbohydrate-binding protein n=1 Tax=Enterobacterales TaxID=91347 RepID=UPI002ED78366